MLSQRVSGSQGLTQKHFSSEQHITQIELCFPLKFSILSIRLLGSHLHYLISYQLFHSNLESCLKQLCIIIDNGIVLVLKATYFGSFCLKVFLVLVIKSTVNLSFISCGYNHYPAYILGTLQIIREDVHFFMGS